jgi:type II secretory pathway pseudopilin PulG
MKRQRGFSYVVVMFLVALLSFAALKAVQVTRTIERRDKEAELLWVGNAYRKAIRDYYEGTSGSSKKYPAKLKDLLYDGRLSNPTRPLRMLYRDPITGKSDWGLVMGANDTIVGVYSLSTEKPIKRDGFLPEQASFTNAEQYSSWQFVYRPK